MIHRSDTPATAILQQDQRLRPPLQASYQGAEKTIPHWRAVAFNAGGDDFLIAASALRAIMTLPTDVTILPGCAAWFRGLVTTEHGVAAVTDLAGFIAETTDSQNKSGQLLLLQSPLSGTALLVDKIHGLQRLTDRPSTQSADLPDGLGVCCSATVMHQHISWPLLNPFKLSCNRRFMNITAD